MSKAKKQKGFKMFNSGQDELKAFKEFYIPTESSSIHFLKAKLCVACAKGFEVVSLETLETQSLLDQADTSLDFVARKEGVRPIHIERLNGEFLLNYSEFSFFVNRYGWRARPDWRIDWEGLPQSFALSYPWILAFEPNFIEIRNIETNAVHIIPGKMIRMLHTSTREVRDFWTPSTLVWSRKLTLNRSFTRMKMNVARMLSLLSISGLQVENQNPIRRQTEPKRKKSTGKHHQGNLNYKCEDDVKPLSIKGVNDFNEHMSSFLVQFGGRRKRVGRTALLPRGFLLMCAGHIVCALIIVRPRGPVLGDGMMQRADRCVLELLLQWDWRTVRVFSEPPYLPFVDGTFIVVVECSLY